MGKLASSLPPPPSSLKLIHPYVLRADELQTKDPVMAYWCLYYAAQIGLDLKTHEPGARDYILSLITMLEKMKKEIGANDAIDHESAGAAYVENFALKVFKLADEEDRRAEATRSTAKKFLAAANFLELLKVFEKSNNAVVNEEKVRYAKWKASDIAKAFREGRKPMPGSPHEETGTDPEVTQESAPEPPSSISEPPDIVVNGDNGAGQRTPPKRLKFAPAGLSVPPPDMSSPGSWSTVATPGSVDGSGPSPAHNMLFASAMNRVRSGGGPEDSPLRSKGQVMDGDIASASTLINSSLDNDGFPLKKVHFSPSVVGGLSSTDGSPPASPEFTGKMFTSVSSIPKSLPQQIPFQPPRSVDPASVGLPDSSPSEGSRSSINSTTPPGNGVRRGHSPPSARQSGSPPSSGMNDRMRPGNSPPSVKSSSVSPQSIGGARLSSSPPSSSRPSGQPSAPPPPSLPSQHAERRERRASNASRHSPPQVNAPRLPQAPPPPPPLPGKPSSYSSTASTSTAASSSPPFVSSDKLPDKTGLPPVTSNYLPQQYTPPGGAAPSPRRVVPVELTPSVIAKAQKHARFAISALEYEDGETARKHLREALAVLGES
ncbi:DUF605-domain-containing protein [Schizopora paradoxa]|uniref:DUF605-domain-containing protein n=1 Tax=Schizopora paradoxa TaxID=27342 RepID=A0A0H2RQX2_9AGAM|nr:DUF605-domain-containing protein [Schizopora paradoxa]